jgi:hypothetical protein
MSVASSAPRRGARIVIPPASIDRSWCPSVYNWCSMSRRVRSHITTRNRAHDARPLSDDRTLGRSDGECGCRARRGRGGRGDAKGRATRTRGGRHEQGSVALVATVAMLSASVTAAHGQARSGSQSKVVAAAFSAEVTGNVKSVDRKSGKLVLDTVDGPVNVTFPADGAGHRGRRPRLLNTRARPDGARAAERGRRGTTWHRQRSPAWTESTSKSRRMSWRS